MPAVYGLPNPPPFTPYLLDVARGASATADSVFSGFVAANAIDGDETTRWNSLNPATNRWLQIDLAKAVKISAFRVSGGPFTDWSGSGFPWAIQSSANGTTWASQYSSSLAPKQDTGVIVLPGVSARYWRLFVTGTGTNVGIPIVTFSLFSTTVVPHA